MKTKFKGAHCDHWDDPRVGMFASQIIHLAISMAETCAIDPYEMMDAVMETADRAITYNKEQAKNK